MPSKYKHWGTRELADTHWKWIVTAVEDPPEKRKFLQWMTEEFGEQGSLECTLEHVRG